MKLIDLFESGWITKFDKIKAQIAHLPINQAIQHIEQTMDVKFNVKYGGPRFNKGPMEVMGANVSPDNVVMMMLTRNVKIKKTIVSDVPNFLSKLRHELSHVKQQRDPKAKLGGYKSPGNDQDASEIEHHHNQMMYILQPTERVAQARDAAEALHRAHITPDRMFEIIEEIAKHTTTFARGSDHHMFIQPSDVAKLRQPAQEYKQYDSLGYQIGNIGLGMGYNRTLGNDLAQKAKAQYKQYAAAVRKAYDQMS